MLKILWKREEIAPEEQFLLLSTIFCYLKLDFYVKIRIRFSIRDKRLFEITEVEITRVDCIVCFHSIQYHLHIVLFNMFISPSLPEIANFSSKYFRLSKVYAA